MSCNVGSITHALAAVSGTGDTAGTIAQSVYVTETPVDGVPLSPEHFAFVSGLVRDVGRCLRTQAARTHFAQNVEPELVALDHAAANGTPAPPTPHLRRLMRAVTTLKRLNPAIPLDGEPLITDGPVAWTIARKERKLVNAVLRRNGYTPIPSKGFRSTALETILDAIPDSSVRDAVREEIVRTLILYETRPDYEHVTKQMLLDGRHRAYRSLLEDGHGHLQAPPNHDHRTVRAIHEDAMHDAQRAMIARETGHTSEAVEYATKAYQKEQSALTRFTQYTHETNDPRVEPTRSNLALSAASLAYQAGLFADALRLVKQGLQGTPSLRVQAELIALQVILTDLMRQ